MSKKINILATDTETNGLNPKKSNAISIAIVMGQKDANLDQLENLDSFYTLINWPSIYPNFYIPEDTIEVHGINLKDLEGQPSPIEAYANCFKFIEKYLNQNQENHNGKVNILNGFNVTFDLHMIIQDLIEIVKYAENEKENSEHIKFSEDDLLCVRKLIDLFFNQDSGEYGAQLNSYGVIESKESTMLVIDSINIDRIYHATDENGVRIRHSLSDVSRRYGLKEDENAHDALSDTIQTIETFNEQLNELRKLGVNPYSKAFEDKLERKYKYVEAAFKKAEVKSYNGR